ncbi:MAG: DUF2635 domain-containing protein [Alphaproteobacteria bacterium]
MMDRIRVMPREGVKVRTEDGSRFIKEKGEPVPLTTYYRRRLRDGDLIEEPPSPGGLRPASAPDTDDGKGRKAKKGD